MTIQDIPAQLAREFRLLGQGTPFDEAAQAVATFTVRPWEAYTLVAAALPKVLAQMRGGN